MIRLLSDENFNNNIARGVRLREPGIDLVRIQDVGLSGADDPSVLEWAAAHQRVLLTHDVATITAFAYERVRAGKSMPGVFELRACEKFAGRSEGVSGRAPVQIRARSGRPKIGELSWPT